MIALRDYQIDVLDRARGRLRAGLRRGIIQGQTGSGKTVIGGELCRAALSKGSRVLVLADRRRLIHQFAGTLDGFGLRCGIIMAGETGATREPVVLASRDTLASWAANPDREIPAADVVITDEAHKSAGATYSSLLALFPRAVHIGLTATPARNDGKSLGDFFQFLECTVSSSQLVREGWLVKPEVYAPVELAARRKKGEGKGLAGDPVSHWKRHADGLPTIAFASRVAESLALCERFDAAGIPAEHIDASADDAEREAKFKRLQSGRTMVLCSVKLLIEGVDIPEVSAAILWSPFGSVIEYMQAVGRIMRPAPGKKRAVVLDHAGAAGVHGLPGEDVEWSLDLASTVGSRRNEAIEAGRKEATVYCKACGVAFTGLPACPACGKPVPRAERKRTMAEEYEAAADAILERFDGEQARSLMREQHQRAWVRAIYTAIARHGTAGMAAQVFQRACKVAPWVAGVEPLPADRGGWRMPAAEVWPQFVRVRA